MTNVPLTPVTPSTQTSVPVESSTSTAVASVETSTITSSSIEPTVAEPVKPKFVNGKEVINFKYESGTAKKVALVGEFNKWYRQPMKRDGDIWSISIPLAPGKYQYVFVVEDGKSGPKGRRVADPNNDQKTKDGKLSLITIKAPSKDK